MVDAVVEIFYLLAVAGDFAHELVNTSIPVTNHFTLMLKLTLQVIFPLLCFFKSHVLEPDGFLKLVDVLIELGNCDLHALLHSVTLDLHRLQMIYKLLVPLLKVSDFFTTRQYCVLHRPIVVLQVLDVIGGAV